MMLVYIWVRSVGDDYIKINTILNVWNLQAFQ